MIIHEIRGILFDWDGTIVDSAEAMVRAFRYAYHKHLGIQFPKDDDEFTMLVEISLEVGATKFGGKYAADIIASYDRNYMEQAYKAGRVFPGMKEILLPLRQAGYLLGVASNKGLRRVRRDVNHLELDGLVDAFATAEDTRERKPHPAPLLKVAEKLGLAPQACAYVGDFKGDIIAAKAGGMLSVAVLWGGMFPVESLLEEKPDYIVARPEDLLAIFPGHDEP